MDEPQALLDVDVCMYVELETTTAPGQPTLQMLIVVGCVCCKKGPAPEGANKVHPSPNLHPIVCPPNRRIACTMFPSSHAAAATYNPHPTLASNSSAGWYHGKKTMVTRR